MKIAVLITCFNRKEKTIHCLKALKKEFAKTDFEYDIHLTDDGCTDGTSEAVLKECPKAAIYKGGDLYWAGGMRLCWAGAVKKGGYDYYLLLNDDTYVNENFIPDFIECHIKEKGNAIIAGAVCNKQGERTYGSYVIISRLPYKTKQMEPTGKPEYVHLSGANVMFIPCKIVNNVGIFPKFYIHGIADFDYCLRSIKNGYKVITPSRYIGTCEEDHVMISCHKLKEMSLNKRINYFFSPKGASIKQWIYYQWSFFPWRVPFVIVKVIKQIIFG